MRIIAAVLARLVERGVRDLADEETLAYVAMVATAADGGSWPGLVVEVTDRAALIDALTTAVEVRTLNRLLAAAALLQVGDTDPGQDRDPASDQHPAAVVDGGHDDRPDHDEPGADQGQRAHPLRGHGPDRTGASTATTPPIHD